MRRIGDRGTDVVTLVHKLVAVVWAATVVGVLVLVAPGLGSHAPWPTVVVLARAGAYAAAVTLAAGLAYAATPWGLLGSRLLLAKWALCLAGVALSGYAIVAARAHEATLVVLLAALQLAVIAVAGATGVHLERSRHAGKLPRHTHKTDGGA